LQGGYNGRFFKPEEVRINMVGLKKGQTNSGSFKEGSIPWNKGLKGVTKVWNKGKKCPQISEGLTGKKLSEEHRKNIGLSQKGRKSHRKGLSYKEEFGVEKADIIKVKISNKMIGSIPWNKLENRESYPYEFNNILKLQIRRRDSFKCQLCNIEQKELNEKLIVHHIDFNKQNNSEENLISLCRSCHGKINCANKIMWIDFFQNIQIKKLEVKNGKLC